MVRENGWAKGQNPQWFTGMDQQKGKTPQWFTGMD
jgi:hypothetical protein